MSKKTPVGLTFVEKIFGIIIAILGVILIYYTYINLDAAGMTAGFSIASGSLLMILGFILLIVRAE